MDDCVGTQFEIAKQARYSRVFLFWSFTMEQADIRIRFAVQQVMGNRLSERDLLMLALLCDGTYQAQSTCNV